MCRSSDQVSDTQLTFFRLCQKDEISAFSTWVQQLVVSLLLRLCWNSIKFVYGIAELEWKSSVQLSLICYQACCCTAMLLIIVILCWCQGFRCLQTLGVLLLQIRDISLSFLYPVRVVIVDELSKQAVINVDDILGTLLVLLLFCFGFLPDPRVIHIT